MTIKGLMSIILIDLLLPAAVMMNIYLYFYPILYSCSFAQPSADRVAEFRLLTLADPQLEGDTSLLRYRRRARTPEALEGMTVTERIKEEISAAVSEGKKYGKMLDLWGNDLYLKHVYGTVKKYTRPSHVAVVGDLVGSQWIGDEEFARRGERFWKIFYDAQPVTHELVEAGHADSEEWARRVIVLPGNHDVGYAGDVTRRRLQRFEDTFGRYNYRLSFHPPRNSSFAVSDPPPELRVAVLNSLTLDTPILDQSLADESYQFIDSLLKNNTVLPSQATVLLTHLPLHKPAGVCVDAPQVKLFDQKSGGGIRSQNFVSETVSNLLKEWVFGFPRGLDGKSRGIIATGHDHEGCDVTHWWDGRSEEREKWNVSTTAEWRKRHEPLPGHSPETGQELKRDEGGSPVETIREITVRSMMGEFGGNAGLLSAWFDWENMGNVACFLSLQF
jgi:hypothetical protein